MANRTDSRDRDQRDRDPNNTPNASPDARVHNTDAKSDPNHLVTPSQLQAMLHDANDKNTSFRIDNGYVHRRVSNATWEVIGKIDGTHAAEANRLIGEREARLVAEGESNDRQMQDATMQRANPHVPAPAQPTAEEVERSRPLPTASQLATQGETLPQPAPPPLPPPAPDAPPRQPQQEGIPLTQPKR